MTEGIVQLNDTNFDSEVINSEVPVLVDFFAPWCGPCIANMNELEKLLEEKKDFLKIGKLNIDESRDITMKCRVSNIPAMLLFKEGKIKQRLIGMMPKNKILSEISKYL